MPDLICIGEAMVEFNQTEPARFLQGFGGDSSNAAIAAARQGARVAYFSAVGADAFGDRLLALWKEEGVDTALVARRADAPTGIYFVTHGPKGHEFSYYRAGSAASRVAPGDVPARLDARIVQASGISQAISPSACDAVFHAFEVARAHGAKTAYDTNFRPRLWPRSRARAVIHEAAAMADYLFPSIDEARDLTGLNEADAIADFYLRLGAKCVALKLGPEGALVADAHGRARVAGHKVKAIDATGAGDVFVGSFLARILAGDEPAAAARYANVAAALSTTGYGAVAPIPRADQVRAALKN